MANINPTVTPDDFGQYITWENLAADDIGLPVSLGKGGAQVAVHALGTFGGSVVIQGSIDGANWYTLTTGPGGSEVIFTAAAHSEITTASRYIRVSSGAGVSNVDVHLSVFA